MVDRLPITGTASVTAGGSTVTWTGDVLSAVNCRPGFKVVIGGLSGYVDELLTTTCFTLLQPYAGAVDAVGAAASIDPISIEETQTAVLNKRAAELLSKISTLDANGRGLFYNVSAETGANDPGPSYLRFNASFSTPASITEAYIDLLDANNMSVGGLVELWSMGAIVIVRAIESQAYVALHVLASPVSMDSGSWYKVSVSHVDSDGLLTDGDAVTVSWNSVIDAPPTFGFAAGEWDADESYAGSSWVTHGGYTFISRHGDNEGNEPDVTPEPTSDAHWMYIPIPVGDKFTMPLFAQGTYASGELLFRVEMVDAVTFPAGLALSVFSAVTAPTLAKTLSLRKNGVEFATAAFAAGETDAVLAAPDLVTFQPGDVFTVYAPAIADVSLADVAGTLRGYREPSLVPEEEEPGPREGTTTIDFGAFPGQAMATAVVTGLTAIEAGSLVQTWVWPVATADHSADEHRLAQLDLTVASVTAGVGFTVTAVGRDGRYHGLYTLAYRF